MPPSEFQYEYTNVADASKAVDLGVEDTLKDQPHLKQYEDDVYREIAQSIMFDCDPDTRTELSRRTGVEIPGMLR